MDLLTWRFVSKAISQKARAGRQQLQAIMNTVAAILLVAITVEAAWAWASARHPSILQTSLPSATSVHAPRSIHVRSHQSPLFRRPTLTISTALASASTSLQQDELASILDNLDTNSLPLLHIGSRIGSGSYGTVHQCLLVNSKTDIQTCVAKRHWTMSELEDNVPLKVANLKEEKKNMAVAQRTGLASARQTSAEIENDEVTDLTQEQLKQRADRCKHYYNVEKHCFEKMEEIKQQNDNADGCLERATPAFLGSYHCDGRGVDVAGTVVPGYGLLENEVSSVGWFGGDKEKSNKGHEWMVFEFVGSESVDCGDTVFTLLDAMEVSHGMGAYLRDTRIDVFSNNLSSSDGLEGSTSCKYTTPLARYSNGNGSAEDVRIWRHSGRCVQISS